MRSLRDEADVLLWGEGELVRPPAIPGEYVSREALALLAPTAAPREDVSIKRAEHLFSTELSWNDARSEALDWAERHEERLGPPMLAAWLSEEAYPKVYGSLAAAVNAPRISLPFLDACVVELLLGMQGSLVDRVDWRPRWLSTLKGRRVYHDIIRANDPTLLRIEVDRGYPLAWDADWRGAMMTGVWGVRSRYRPVRVDLARTIPLQTLLRNVLLDGSLVDYLDRGRVIAGVSKPMPWPPEVEFELAKAAAVQMLFR
jgi:hypothetical protein